jgi:hypothetical protein
MGPVQTKTVKISFDGKILLSEIMDNMEIDLDDVFENYEASLKLTGDRPFLSLVISAPYTTVTKEAREAMNDPRYYKNTVAQAIVVKSLANRLMGNFLIRLYKQYCPHRLFNSREEAVKWLNYQWEKSKINV